MSQPTVSIDNNEQGKTIDEVVSEAQEIYANYKEYGFQQRIFRRADKWKINKKKLNKEKNAVKMSTFLKETQELHKDFAMAYPIQLRYMIQLGEYNTDAFREYLEYIIGNPTSDESKYIENQGYYIKLVYKHNYPHLNEQYLNNIRDATTKLLKDEHENFKKLVDQADAELKAEKEQREQEKRNDLIALIKSRSNNKSTTD